MCGLLSWMELEEVVIDVEIILNNRPLSYVEDDVAQPTLKDNHREDKNCRRQLQMQTSIFFLLNINSILSSITMPFMNLIHLISYEVIENVVKLISSYA